jgi:hypothetical protein
MHKLLCFLILLGLFSPLLSEHSHQERLIFVHIPKNGGTSIRTLLYPRFNKEDVYFRYFVYNIEEKPSDWYLPYKFICGHFPLFYIKQIPGKRITFLRDPVQRVLSAHQYWNRYWKKRTLKFARELQLPPGDPLETMKNHQTLFLSGLDPNNPSISIEKHLKLAKENLKKFFFFGFVEQIDESMQRLFVLLNFPPPKDIPRRNVSKPETYSKETIRAIKNRNRADIELYDFAKKLYNERFRIHG